MEAAKPGVPSFRFICGCWLGIGKVVDYDSEGFIICAEHRQRRYGWRSLPTKLAKMHKHPDMKRTPDEFKSVADYRDPFDPLVREGRLLDQLRSMGHVVPTPEMVKAAQDAKDELVREAELVAGPQ